MCESMFRPRQGSDILASCGSIAMQDQWQLPFSDLFEQILSQNWEVTDVNP